LKTCRNGKTSDPTFSQDLTITSSFCFDEEWLFEWNIKLTGTACFHAGRKTFKKSVRRKQTILLYQHTFEILIANLINIIHSLHSKQMSN
jgi:hypothetical protein